MSIKHRQTNRQERVKLSSTLFPFRNFNLLIKVGVDFQTQSVTGAKKEILLLYIPAYEALGFGN